MGDTGVEPGRWRPVPGGSVGSVVVVVDVPHRKGLRSLGFAGPVPGVEELLGQNPVVALDLPVVPWGVRAVPTPLD